MKGMKSIMRPEDCFIYFLKIFSATFRLRGAVTAFLNTSLGNHLGGKRAIEDKAYCWHENKCVSTC